MAKRMLVDASHPEETRVVVLDGNRVEEFDFEAATKRPLKGNIYLAKVTRVEPSLQAAFVEYGGNRQGFLAFSEIHPDYYQIPVADRMAILQAQTERRMAEEDFDSLDVVRSPAQQPMPGTEAAEEPSDQTVAEHVGYESGDANEPAADQVVGTVEPDDAMHAPPDAPDEADSGEAIVQEQSRVADLPDIAEATPNPEDLASAAPAKDEESPQETIAVVQAEATGAPTSHQRRGPSADRQHDRGRQPRRRQYKIQEVIKRRQVMLVQVVKEERGNKGASLTTFLSLAGRYCVLMPNTPRGGGISRKITNAVDRKRLKSAAQSLELPEGMGLIIRTAGANRTKLEIKRDYEYLLRLWDTVRELTLKSNAPSLVYEEGSLIKRAIRDLYSKDISEIIVDGEAGYRDAKEFMRMLMPSHAKNVKLYKEALPLFQRLQVESQLDAMFSPVVNLRSGGYIVINQTEALVSIDVNSGKATREHSIEETATKTNLEAADEIARQLRLRDLAGLIVIDFIDMEDSKNDRNVEKRLHNAVRGDRARIQIGKISQFGLLEMSRQRLRAGVLAGSTVTCPHCNGQGIIRSTESAALRLLRALDEEGQRQPAANITAKAPADVTIYTLNQKRREIARIEEAYDLAISFEPQATMMGGTFELQRTGVRVPTARPKSVVVSVEAGFQDLETEEAATDVTIVEAPVETAPSTESAGEPGQANGEQRRKRRRRRRGGRGRGVQPDFGLRDQDSREPAETQSFEANPEIPSAGAGEELERPEPVAGEEPQPRTAPAVAEGEDKHRRRRRRGRRGRRREGERPSFAGDITASGTSADQNAEITSSGTVQERTVVPNAPSSPSWSLLDLACELRPSAAEAGPADMRAVQPADEAREPVSIPEQPEAEAAATPENARRETRKGWWQRRLKM
jgi:ribonuclease E